MIRMPFPKKIAAKTRLPASHTKASALIAIGKDHVCDRFVNSEFDARVCGGAPPAPCAMKSEAGASCAETVPGNCVPSVVARLIVAQLKRLVGLLQTGGVKHFAITIIHNK
jgi:hypothetical protein